MQTSDPFDTDVAVIGAGPYGLSLGAYLQEAGVRHRIFGRPMQSWQSNMPQGMFLKSDGYACDLYDPKRSFTLEHFYKEQSKPYQRVGMPIPLEMFVAYRQSLSGADGAPAGTGEYPSSGARREGLPDGDRRR